MPYHIRVRPTALIMRGDSILLIEYAAGRRDFAFIEDHALEPYFAENRRAAEWPKEDER